MRHSVSFYKLFDKGVLYLQDMQEQRYLLAKRLILEGSIKNVRELLELLSKSAFAMDIKTSPKRLKKLLENPALFQFQDAYNIAALIGVDERLIVDLIFADRKKPGKKR